MAGSYGNIGAVYAGKGDFENALVQFQKGLEIRTRVFGSDHLDVAATKYNIANLKETQGDLEGARRLFLECEQIYAKVLGADHEETLDAAMRALTVGHQQSSWSSSEEEEDEEGEEEDSDRGEEDDQAGDSGER